jgi:hypothetical protein
VQPLLLELPSLLCAACWPQPLRCYLCCWLCLQLAPRRVRAARPLVVCVLLSVPPLTSPRTGPLTRGREESGLSWLGCRLLRPNRAGDTSPQTRNACPETKFMNHRHPGPSPSPRFRGSRCENPNNPLKTNMHGFGPKNLRAKRASNLFKMLVGLPALLGAPRGPPGRRFINTRAFIYRRSLVHNTTPSRNGVFVGQTEKRPHRSKALAAQIPNPGSVARRAKREIFDFCPPPWVPTGALLKAS